MTRTQLEKEYDEFFATFNGMSVEVVDSNARNQCVDLAVAWADWLELPRRTNQQYYAYQIYTETPEYVLTYMDKIPNTPDYVPMKGDFVIWDKAINGTAGHIGIGNGVGDTNKFQSFDQNWSKTQSVSQIINHDYTHVLGALRLKVTGSADTPMNPKLQEKASGYDRVWNPFKHNGKTSENSGETDQLSFVEWLKSNISRAGKWDALCLKLGIKTASEAVSVDQVLNTAGKELKDQISNLEAQLLNASKDKETALEKADLDAKQALSQQRVEMLSECASEKKVLQDEINDLKKNGKIVYKDKPLSEYFKGMTMIQKILKVLKI